MCMFVCMRMCLCMCVGGSFRTLPAYALKYSFIPRAVFIGNNLPKELIDLSSNLCVFEERIRYITTEYQLTGY